MIWTLLSFQEKNRLSSYLAILSYSGLMMQGDCDEKIQFERRYG